MKQSTLITWVYVILLTMMALLAASCSSSSDEAVTAGGGLQPTEGNNLVVYIGTASNLSRAAATTDPGQAAENQINRVTLLIFGQNGIAKSIQEVVPTGQLTTHYLDCAISVLLNRSHFKMQVAIHHVILKWIVVVSLVEQRIYPSSVNLEVSMLQYVARH